VQHHYEEAALLSLSSFRQCSRQSIAGLFALLSSAYGFFTG
jgi:hypothetical protein